MTSHAKLNRATKTGAAKADTYLPSLTRAYGRALRAAGRRAATNLEKTETVTAAANPKPPDWQPPPTDQIINAAELAADTQRKTAKIHRAILSAAATTALEPFGIAFDIKAATSQAALEAVAKRIQDGISAAIQTEITTAITNGYAEGHSVRRVATAIRAATDQISRPRADMLARTDLVALSNAGSHIAASQIDGVTTKSWLTAADDRVREMHVEADGQTVPINDPFDVCDQSPMYPGDPILDDECACNCRCTIMYGTDPTEGISQGDNTPGIVADAGPDVSNLAMVAVYPLAAEAEAIAIPDGHPPEKMHVTLVFLGEADSFDTAAVHRALASVARASDPLAGTVGGLGRFAEGPDGAPIIALPDVQGLSALREAVVTALAAVGIESPSEHGWTPHLTLDYSQDGEMPPDDCLGLPLTFTTLSYAEADQRNDFALGTGDMAVNESGSVPARVHYRPAGDRAEACDTCGFYTSLAEGLGYCSMFAAEVIADYTCDEWVAETDEEGITSGGTMSIIDVETLTAEQRAELRANLDKPLSPLATKMAAVREALAENGASDTFGDDELRAVIVTLEALRLSPTVTLENAVLLAATEGGTPWQATLCVAGQATIDSGIKRLLDREGGSWLPLPLPLAIMDDSPHADMVTSSPMCGRIDQIWMAGDVCQASGVFFDSSDDPDVASAGSRAAAIVGEMRRMGISVDLVDTEVELVRWQESGEMDAPNDPTDDLDIPGMPAGEIVEVLYDEAEEAEYVYLFRRWVIAGATICPVQALTQATISLVASAFDGRGAWRTVTEFGAPDEPSLTAGAAGMVPVEPPAAWFDDPALEGPTPLTVTDEGRVFGHLAAWDTCHTGRPGCTPPPRSPTGYMNFHLGELVTAEGSRISVGTLTFDAPHASLPLSASQAVRHYDDTATAGAHVRAGEDAYGIWLAGALNPRLSAEEARTLMAAPPSGDWRQVQSGQGRDLVGAHAVNQPGFIVQRRGLSLAASAECDPCDEMLARELEVLAASADGIEGLAALVSG